MKPRVYELAVLGVTSAGVRVRGDKRVVITASGLLSHRETSPQIRNLVSHYLSGRLSTSHNSQTPRTRFYVLTSHVRTAHRAGRLAGAAVGSPCTALAGP